MRLALAVLACSMPLHGCGEAEAPKEARVGASEPLRAHNLAVAIADTARDEAPPPGAKTPPPSESRPPKPMVSRETSPTAAADPDYRAIGTEPFWAVTVRGQVATLDRPGEAPLRYRLSRQDDAHAIRFRGEGFAMTVTPGPCSDGMSEAIWSDRVQIAFSGGTLKGCGGMRESDDRREQGL